MTAEPAGRDHPVLLAQHHVRGHGGVFQLLQPGQHQRLDQQLKIGRAVRGVVDDAGQLALAHAVRCGADRQGGQQAAERQPKRPLAKNVGDGQDRRPCDELSDHFELDRTPAGPTARRGDTGHAACPATSFEFERDPAAQRVADDMAGFPAQFVELAFDVVGQHRRGQKPGARGRSAVVAGHRGGKYLEAAGVGQLLGDLLPHRLGHQERV